MYHILQPINNIMSYYIVLKGRISSVYTKVVPMLYNQVHGFKGAGYFKRSIRTGSGVGKKKSRGSSPTWASLLDMKCHTEDRVCWRIEGGWTKIIEEPWIPNLPKFRIVESRIPTNGPKLVRELMNTTTNTCKSLYFNPTEATAIANIRITEGGGIDELIWTKVRNGKFTPKFLCEELRRQEPGSSSNCHDKSSWRKL